MNFTTIQCGECGGTYVGFTLATEATCADCGHTIVPLRDIVLDEGERLALEGGVLGYVS